jgi:dCMP deaminase
MREANYKWNIRFLQLARTISDYSKDPSTKVGAIIFDDDNRIISQGYNGFAQRVRDLPERLSNREMKYKLVVHAEMNALLFSKRDLTGCTIATWPLPPCSNCAAAIIQAGIRSVIAPQMTPELRKRWQESIDLSMMQFEEAGITYLEYPIHEIVTN